VVGRGEFGNYWIIKNPDGSGECWLWGNYATVTGPTDGLQEYASPATPTPAFDWAGNWTISQGLAAGGVYSTWSMVITATGRTFTGTIDFMGVFATFNGTISDDYLTVSGNWQDVLVSGPFKLYAMGANQFNGNYSDGMDDYGICGVKGGGASPSPCYQP
jgi:hypothetical protein